MLKVTGVATALARRKSVVSSLKITDRLTSPLASGGQSIKPTDVTPGNSLESSDHALLHHGDRLAAIARHVEHGRSPALRSADGNRNRRAANAPVRAPPPSTR